MYDDFHAEDKWSKKKVHCLYQALIVAIATRHADAVDIKFLANGRPAWIALPHEAWINYHNQTKRVITDPLAIQAAGHYVKTAIESGYYSGQEMFTLTVDETLEHLRAVLVEFHAPNEMVPQVPSHSQAGA